MTKYEFDYQFVSHSCENSHRSPRPTRIKYKELGTYQWKKFDCDFSCTVCGNKILPIEKGSHEDVAVIYEHTTITPQMKEKWDEELLRRIKTSSIPEFLNERIGHLEEVVRNL